MKLRGSKIVVFGGATGLLGQAISKALIKAGCAVLGLSSKDIDVLNPEDITALLKKEKPDCIINAVAYTHVDNAEDEKEQAFGLNAKAPELMVKAAQKESIPFVHFSTDFVFDGSKKIPYTETDATNASSVYGSTKAEGEKRLLEYNYEKTLIIRISWLFGPDKTNFVEKILTLARSKEQLGIVSDQTGSPSYTPDIAKNMLELLRCDTFGIVHLANTETASWFDLAHEAVTLAKLPCRVLPISTEQYPTKAARPPYSVLDLKKFTQKTGITPRPWRQALAEYVQQLEETAS